MGKIMCLDTSVVKAVNEVQKHIPLETYLKKRTAFYDEQELKSVQKENLSVYPLTFSVSVRSAGNEVVYFNDKKNKRKLFYHSLVDVEKMVHEGYDLVMFLGSISIQNMLLNRSEKTLEVLNDVMFNGSVFNVQGLYYNGFINPVVYSIITILDDYFEKFKKCLGKEYGVMTIDEMNSRKNAYGNIRVFLNELKEVRAK